MRKILSFLLVLTMVLPLMAAAESAEMSISVPDTVIRPGKAYLISFELPEAGSVEITLEDSLENRISVVVLDQDATAGLNQLWWNGTYNGVPAPAGTFRMVLAAGEQSAETPVTIGEMAPYITAIQPDSDVITPDKPMTVTYYAGNAGRMTTGVWYGSEWRQLASWSVTAGEGAVSWDGSGFYDGTYTFTMMLTDATGDASNEEHLQVSLSGFGAPVTRAPEQTAAAETPAPTDEVTEAPVETPVPTAGDVIEKQEPAAITLAPETTEEPELPVEPESELGDETVMEPVTEGLDDGFDAALDDGFDDFEEVVLEEEQPEAADQSQFTPSYGSPYTGTDTTMNYWTLPMDITDEEAVWEMLMKPITVVDIGKKSSEKVQTYLRARPDENSEPVGVVTCETQGVHVLENLDNGWSLVECYSSSFHGTSVEAWNMLVQGYIKTSYLKQVKPNQKMGIVVDKLTQRLYLFKDGKLFSTLLVSTGLSNKDQPYNETRTGEFITASKVGEFRSDNLFCSMAVRFNQGDLLHEVPHTKNGDGSKNYKKAEEKLGVRASHGCIRVQRKKTPEGVNMTWIWNNLKTNSFVKLVIWEDWQGRQMPIPDGDLQLYHNPKGGEYYHRAATCYSASKKTFEPFNYSELETSAYAALKACPYCVPVLRVSEIEAINAEHAVGGDHDPVLTKLRVKFIDYLQGLDTGFLK